MPSQVTFTLRSASPLIQSRKHNDEKRPKETADAYEARTWRSKAHIVDGYVAIPAMAIKQSMEAMGKHLGMQVPGKGKATYTKHIVSGMSTTSLSFKTNVLESEIVKQSIFCNSDGLRGSGKRVDRFFPMINDWDVECHFQIFDDALTESVFLEHLKQSGMLKGIGAFRAENGGFCGRFMVTSFDWSEFSI